MVNFAYGKRGATLTTGTKTSFPVSEDVARKIFDKLIAEKKAKGYTEGQDVAAYSQSTGEHSGIFPQLLNEMDEAQLQRCLADDAWCAQQKHDGRRIMVRKQDNKVEAINRKGLIVGAPQPVLDVVAQIPGNFILDGEMVGDTYWAFDIVAPTMCYEDRVAWVHDHLQNSTVVRPVYTAYTSQSKLELYADLTAANAEGVVFKRLDSLYRPGRPNSGGDMLKFKFYATLSAIVSRINTKRSVGLDLWDGIMGRMSAGNVTIPPNHDMPKTNAIVEVRYLYATSGGILYQPVYLSERTDLTVHACVRSQLKYKGQEDDE